MPGARQVDRPPHQLREVQRLRIDHGPVGVHGRVQDVVDRRVQALDVLAHRLVEVLAAALGQVAQLERVEIQLQRRDGRLQFVRHGRDEVGLALVEAHLADQQDHEQSQPADQEQEQHQAEEVDDEAQRLEVARDAGLFRGEELPAERERHGDRDEEDPNRDVEPLGTLAGGELRTGDGHALEQLVEIAQQTEQVHAAPEARLAGERQLV